MSLNRLENQELFDLLTEVRAGNESAFSKLVSLYQPLLLDKSLRFSCGDESKKEDAYQEACLALHRAALTYDETKEATFGLYARVCVVNALRSQYRREATAPDTVPLDEELLLADSFDELEEQENFERLLARINAELSVYERKVFALYIDDVSVSEIAEMLGKDEKSIRNAITRIKVKLREKLGH